MSQPRFFCFLSSFLGVFLTASGFAAPENEIPFKLLRDSYIFVEGSVGSQDKVNLLIDTGAAMTTVDWALARRLKLGAVDCRAQGLLGEDREVAEVELPLLSFGPVTVEGLRALAMDLSGVKLGKRIDVIVGLDVLRRTDLTIDYRSRRLTFGSGVPFSSRADLATLAPFLTVSVEFDGQPVRLMLDSGSRETVLFESRMGETLSGLPMLDKATIPHAGGQSFARRVQLPHVALGDANWKRLAVLVLDRRGPEGLELDGLLSLRSLGAERVHFDFQEGSVSWDR